MTQPRQLAETILEMQGVNIFEILGTLAEATEVIKQLVDDYDAGTLELDNQAVVTKARKFLDGLKG